MRRSLILLGCIAAIAAPRAEVPQPRAGEGAQDGLRVTWRYEGREEPGIGMLEIRVSDAATGAPVRYERGRLVAWLQRRRAALPEAETTCADRVRLLARQGIGQRADIDLNTHRIVTLNTDGTLAVVNPFVPLNNAKLESIVELGGTPRAWLPIPERMEAWVVLADPHRLVRVDLQSRRIGRSIALPGEASEAALGWEAATGRLFLALGGRQGLGVVTPDHPEAPLALLPGAAPESLLVADGLPAPVTGHEGGDVVLHATGAERHWTLPGGGRVGLLAHSAQAGRIIAATADGRLAWIDPGSAGAAPERVVELGHPATALALADGGRRALVMGGGQASLLDLATARVEARMQTLPQAHELLLTDRFAYALSLPEGRATLWPLGDLRQGLVHPVEVTLGRAGVALPPGGAAHAAPLPSGTGILVASPADGMVYQYGEGMMAPIGSYSNYRRAAFGLHVLDLSPREVAAGLYRSPVRHLRGGPHELVLAGASPRFALCGPLDLPATAASPAMPDTALRVELVTLRREEASPATIRIRVDAVREGRAEPLDGIADLELLLFDRHTAWEGRAPLRAAGASGEYAARIAIPAGARVEAMVGSDSRNLSFAAGRIGVLPGASP
ncbi:hypothetical protein MVG78_21015 (plasmid) [Roseomonas gilardii subsp. gilardii]|uniref:hypothetical protein n=1 Tax=Roseomonas gilardii TaxID=257708 RepID=UPI001FF9024B|nr:hypothetical protein [Roseomonas gilardii]UPG74577.1 hypothetical protein MVG78_21015 [Roseomonas gilardii subsp. gilardii]